ncbi:transcriptional regulator with XRE-family HTH domain [Bartonella callosciuri]|uniref:Transcriptional regulator with XRE-family HTH domain n=1 Tax=Bartonella callosciuri TaxID=686223 RepID=A0A840NWS3_9HYPH|nr:transcriptional regulator with XRE-family HTH domain [Bartonella callosciuri]
MLTPFSKTLRKLRIDHSERLLDMAKKLGMSIAFLSSGEIGKKTVPVGMEDKIIKLYALDQETAARLRKESDASRTSFTIRPSNPLSCEIFGMFVRVLDVCSQEDLEAFKKLLEKISKKECVLEQQV